MRVFLTGAFGLIGRHALPYLLDKGHEVLCFDINTSSNRKIARRLQVVVPKPLQIIWGDIGDRTLLRQHLSNIDVVIHNAGCIPPATESNPALAERVNVQGTEGLIEMMEEVCPQARLIFASSFSVYGADEHRVPPLRATTPIAPSDVYTRQKWHCEQVIQASSLSWCIMRIGAVIRASEPPKEPGLLSILFNIDPTCRVEVVDARDVGLAQANAVTADVGGKLLLIGGGKACQVTYRALMEAMEAMLRCGPLPPKAFGKEAYYTDWMDTTLSQSLLSYQQHTFADYCEESLSFTRRASWLLRLCRPLVRWGLLRFSTPWRQKKCKPRTTKRSTNQWE